MKKTAIEKCIEKVQEMKTGYHADYLEAEDEAGENVAAAMNMSASMILSVLQSALPQERQDIEDAWTDGALGDGHTNSINYFNHTFKSPKQ